MSKLALFGRRRDLVAQQNPLLEPDELLLDPSGELLVFRSENQGRARWGVALADLSREDPPVALFADRSPAPADSTSSTACRWLVWKPS
ncbi:hypothetical protein ADK52_20220 [Streptomyces sp. WM6372]|uniref:hypothetical protein n=1 Tax=Streptomyces sp. WM6372 TaxID=1415555 RepID=UPI0006BFA983|nr:hypothetical protein [Streptomyces sp. WM6372]KOU22743.1 hypothetical protein ADK52_20220 [Streptomyces sp. WM6372]